MGTTTQADDLFTRTLRPFLYERAAADRCIGRPGCPVPHGGPTETPWNGAACGEELPKAPHMPPGFLRPANTAHGWRSSAAAESLPVRPFRTEEEEVLEADRARRQEQLRRMEARPTLQRHALRACGRRQAESPAWSPAPSDLFLEATCASSSGPSAIDVAAFELERLLRGDAGEQGGLYSPRDTVGGFSESAASSKQAPSGRARRRDPIPVVAWRPQKAAAPLKRCVGSTPDLLLLGRGGQAAAASQDVATSGGASQAGATKPNVQPKSRASVAGTSSAGAQGVSPWGGAVAASAALEARRSGALGGALAARSGGGGALSAGGFGGAVISRSGGAPPRHNESQA